VAGIHRQAEAVGAEHRAGMEADALAQANARHQRDACDELAALADHAILADDAARSERRAGVDVLRAPIDDMRADVRAGSTIAVASTTASGCTPGAACGTGSNNAEMRANAA
jgi:hypothetical protein